MRQLRSNSVSPKSLAFGNPNMLISNRTLRSSTSRSISFSDSSSDRDMTDTSPSHKRSWSLISSDSHSSSVDEQRKISPAAELNGSRKVRRTLSKLDVTQPCQLQPLAPPASPSNSSTDGSVGELNEASFIGMPTEVHQQICDYLPTDRDVANYAQLCTLTSKYVNSSVWRRRFLTDFDPIKNATINYVHSQYVERRRFEQRYIQFDDGPHPLHGRCLAMLRDLIIQSDARIIIDADGNEEVVGLNHNFIKQFMAAADARRTHGRGTNLIDTICNTGSLFYRGSSKSSRSPNSLVLIIQLCLLHLVLDPMVCTIRAQRFVESQEQVYKCYRDQPIFRGKNKGEINFPWLLHVANFFKFHFKQHDGEGMLSHMYDGLAKIELPRPWSGKVQGGTQELGKRWKGTYSYLVEEDLAAIREGDNEILVDETNEGNNGFQDLTLFFDIKGHPELQFTGDIEEAVHGKPAGLLRDATTGKMAIPEVKDFFGLGYDGTTYHFNGRIHSLPPQGGIPGFQRVTMMKFLPDEEGNYSTGRTSGWAYEGCVLPGNEIMLGRWWRAGTALLREEPSYSGPFIFWRVDGSAEDKLKDATTALKFLDSIDELMGWH